jgi:hypothetical protein
MRRFFVLGISLLGLLLIVSTSRAGSADKVTIVWKTDKPSTSCIEYTGADGFTRRASDERLVTEHSLMLAGLQPGTKYRYRISSTDAAGNGSYSSTREFVTLSSADPFSGAPVISDIDAANVVAGGDGAGDEVTGKGIKNEPAIERPLVDKGYILLKKNQAQIEPGFSYAHISANRVAINGITILPMLIIGEIGTETVKRDVFIETLTGRYGILDNLQVELRVPYRSEFDRESNSSFSTERTFNQSGWGDIDGTVLWQFFKETASMPDLIAGVNVKSRTGKDPYGREIGLGTGHWAYKGSLMAVKTADPAVLFGGIGYTQSIARDVDGSNNVKPGVIYNYNFGFAFALNYQFGLNFQFENSITESMKVDGERVPGSFTNAASFKCGASWSYSPQFSANVNVGIGLSDDSPDFTIDVRFPYTF